MQKVFLFLITLLFLTTSINAQVIHEILKRMQNHQGALVSLKSDVQIKEKYTYIDYTGKFDLEMCAEELKKIKFTETRFGKLTYYSDINNEKYYVRLDTEKPFEETFVIKNGKYITYQPQLNQAITGSLENKDLSNFFDLLNASKNELVKENRVRKLDNAIINNEEVWHLQIHPTTEKLYKSVDFWVDGNGMINQMQVNKINGDWKTITLSNFEKNVKIQPTLFTVRLPKNINLIQE